MAAKLTDKGAGTKEMVFERPRVIERNRGVRNKEIKRSRIVERYTFLERATHLIHLISMFVLLITGFKIYLGWDFMLFDRARALHMIAVPVFLVANWILVPYNVFFGGEGKWTLRGTLSHFFEAYIFNQEDAARVKGMILNFFGRGKYPAFTVYDAGEEHYRTKLHPILKLLIIFESTAIFFIAISGVVLYSPDWALLGLPVSRWIISTADLISPLFNISALGLLRFVHLVATYWFLFELTLHVGILELDPHVWKYYKAIFWSGKEDLSDKAFVEVIEKE